MNQGWQGSQKGQQEGDWKQQRRFGGQQGRQSGQDRFGEQGCHKE